MARKDTKMRAVKNFYKFENYKPNKNAKPIVYEGTNYLSKAQCMALEGITRKELEEYLKNQNEAELKVLAEDTDVINELIGPDVLGEGFIINDNEPF